MTFIEKYIEEQFLKATLTSSNGIIWKITDNTDASHCLSMTKILKILFGSIKHKNRQMIFIPLDIWCPPMAPIDLVAETNKPASSRWRFCVKCHDIIKEYGRLVLLFVSGISKEKQVMSWEPMLACANCTSEISHIHHYFPWIVCICSLWSDTIRTALNVCHMCLCPVEDKIVCGEECSTFMQALENLKNKNRKETNKETASDLKELIAERMINAKVSIHEPILCSQCTVVSNCFKKARGNCKRCGKIAFCAFHKGDGEKHIEEENCAHFLDIWDSKSFVIL